MRKSRCAAVTPAWLAAMVAMCLLPAAGAMGQVVPAPPELNVGGSKGPSAAETRDLDLVEKLGDRVPMDAVLVDESGQTVRLGDFFEADRPVILNLGYYGCPMLCGQMVRGLGTSLRELEDRDGWVPGQNYEVVTISFAPNEGPAMASEAKQQAVRMFQDEQAGDGWHFLTGDDAQVRAIAEAVGFPYRWSERARQYVHPAAIMLLTPEGEVARYLYGITYPTMTLRLSLVESSQGKVGSTVDRVLLFCFQFDETHGEYTMVAVNMMRIAGALTVVVLAIAIGVMTVRGLHRQAQYAESTDNDNKENG